VECISKSKSRNHFEFGVKVSIATTSKVTLNVSAKAFRSKPYFGHTLNEQLQQDTILL
jgi:IS5 family transposase